MKALSKSLLSLAGGAPWISWLLLAGGAATAQPQLVIHTVVDSFTRTDPFSAAPTPAGFAAACEATATFRAAQHSLRDIGEEPPAGLAPWVDALRYFFGGRPFPGSWDGYDAGGADREMIMMEWAEVPRAVRRWVARQQREDGEGRWAFGVYERPREEGAKVKGAAKLAEEEGAGNEADERIVLFAAGAIYDILPLWVSEGSGCEAELTDLERYRAAPKDGSVVAWVTEHSLPNQGNDDKTIRFAIKAQLLRAAGGDKAKYGKDEAASSTEGAAEKSATAKVESDGEAKDEL